MNGLRIFHSQKNVVNDNTARGIMYTTIAFENSWWALSRFKAILATLWERNFWRLLQSAFLQILFGISLSPKPSKNAPVTSPKVFEQAIANPTIFPPLSTQKVSFMRIKSLSTFTLAGIRIPLKLYPINMDLLNYCKHDWWIKVFLFQVSHIGYQNCSKQCHKKGIKVSRIYQK